MWNEEEEKAFLFYIFMNGHVDPERRRKGKVLELKLARGNQFTSPHLTQQIK